MWAGYRGSPGSAERRVGFCSSSKPRGYQFSFGQLAANTRALAEWVGFAPNTAVSDGVARFVQWFKEFYAA